MSTIGVDCELILDGFGYFLKPGSYAVKWPRVRKATIRADNNESYVDLGAGKREWMMVILAMNDLLNFDGSTNSNDGQAIRTALLNSYVNNVGITISYTDPLGSTFNVHFDNYIEHIPDIHSQIIAVAAGGSAAKASFEIAIALIES